MNSLAPVQPKASPSRRTSYAEALKAIRAERQPLIDYDRLYAEEQRYAAYRFPLRHPPLVERVLSPSGEDDYRLMCELHQTLKPTTRLRPIRDGIAEIVNMEPDSTRARLVIGLMVDGFPNARPHSPEGYVERLVDEVMGEEISPPVLAHACAKMIQSQTFLPAVSEVLAKCASIGTLPRLLERIDRAIEARLAADALFAEAHRQRSEIVPAGDLRWPWEIRRDEQFARMYGRAG